VRKTAAGIKKIDKYRVENPSIRLFYIIIFFFHTEQH